MGGDVLRKNREPCKTIPSHGRFCGRLVFPLLIFSEARYLFHLFSWNPKGRLPVCCRVHQAPKHSLREAEAHVPAAASIFMGAFSSKDRHP